MVYRAKRHKKELRKRFLKKFLLKVFLPIFVLFLASIFLWNASFLKLDQIRVSGLRTIQEKEIIKIVENILSKNYLAFYHKDNFLFYPESRIKKELIDKIKKIAEVKISYNDFWSKDIEIKIKEKEGAFLYCRDKKQKCFFMEKDGEIFSEYKSSETEKGKEEFLLFSDLNYQTIPDFFLQEKDFTKLRSLILDFQNLDLKIVSVIKTKDNEYLLKTSSGTVLVILPDQDFSKVIKTFKKISLKKDLEIDREKKDFKKTVAYINFTFGDMIYYCTDNQECRGNYKDF